MALRRNVNPEDAASTQASAPTHQEPAQAGTPTHQEPAQAGTTTHQEPAQAGTTTHQEPAQAGTPTHQEPAQTGTPTHQEPAQAAAPAVRQAAPPPAATSGSMGGKIFAEMENKFIAEFGVLPRLKAATGNFLNQDDKSIGNKIEIQLLSWNKNYVVGPCDNKAPADLVKYSYDREIFADGSGRLDDYVAELKAAGWPQAAVKEYYDIVAYLRSASGTTDLVGEMVSLQLAPTSVKDFEGYRLQTTFKLSLKPFASVEEGEQAVANTALIAIEATPVSNKGNNWTKMVFKSVFPL